MVIFFIIFFSFDVLANECIFKIVPLNNQNFQSQYNGFGEVTIQDKIILNPKISVKKEETHAALVLYKKPLENFKVRIKYRVKPLRTDPNPWEVFWIFFNYQDKQKKETNYFIFKTNGIELGKAWGEVEQSFIKTKDYPKLDYNKIYTLSLIKNEKYIEVFIDGNKVLFSDKKAIDQLFSHKGQLGLDSEDAFVEIIQFEICI